MDDNENRIQGIDACRTQNEELLLVELEDLNPYRSILEIDLETREKLLKEFICALKNILK